MHPSKAFFIFIIALLISNISFDSFLKFPSLYLHYPSILVCCLLFCNGVLSILIIVILNLLSENCKICVISESGSHACSVSSDWVCLCFSMSFNFLWKPEHDVSGNRH